MRLQYPPEIKIILMPCTGRVDILHLLKAFEGGADAVFVAGCLEGECHYLMGNIRARKRVAKLKKDFTELGIELIRGEMKFLDLAVKVGDGLLAVGNLLFIFSCL